MQSQDLGCTCGVGLPPDQAQRPALPPTLAVVAAGSRYLVQKADDGIDGGAFVDAPDPGADHQAHFRQAVRLLFLDELVVGGRAAEARRQHIVDQPDQIRADEVHALAGQLLVAADGVQVQIVADAIERTAAGSALERAVVVADHVDHQLGCVGEQGRVDVGHHVRSDADRLRPLNQGDTVGHHMDLVGAAGPGAGKAENPCLAHVVGAGDATADPLEDPHLGRRDRFTADPEQGPGDVQAFRLRGQGDAHSRSGIGVEDGGPAFLPLRRQPVRDPPCFAQRNVFRNRQAHAAAAAAVDRGRGQQRMLPGPPGKAQPILREPLVGDLAELHAAHDPLDAGVPRGRRSPECIGPLEQVERFQELAVVRRVLGVVLQIDVEPRAAAPGTSGLDGEVSGRERMVEIPRCHGRLEAAASDRTSALELVEPQIHPGVEQLFERPLDALLLHQVRRGPEIDARVCEELPIGAQRCAEDRGLEDMNQILCPPP